MAWYYIEIHHGSGGQSTTVRFEWHKTFPAIKRKERLEELHDAYMRPDGAAAVVKMARVRKLPSHVWAQKKNSAEVGIELGYQALAILHDTKMHEPRCRMIGPDRYRISRQCSRPINHKGAHRYAAKYDRKVFG